MMIAFATISAPWCAGQTEGIGGVVSISVEAMETGAKALIKSDGPLAEPRVERLSDPERLVFDVVGATPKNGYQRIPVSSQAVRSVRTSFFGKDKAGRPVTRIVFDLRGRSDFEAVPTAEGMTITVSGRAGKLPPKQQIASSLAKAPAPKALPVRGDVNLLKSIAVREEPTGTVVMLDFTQPAQASMQNLQSPRRFVLDFAGAQFAVGRGRPIKTDSASLRGIRSALFRENPPMLRVVFDERDMAPAARVSVVGSSVRVEYKEHIAPSQAASAKMPPPPAIADREPAESSAKADMGGISPDKPRVTYNNGLLTVDANNSILADVLYAIGEQTGADIQLPFSDAMMDRVVLKMGPVTARQLIGTLLEGSGYTYFIVEDGRGRLQKVILTPKQSPGATAAQ